MEILPCRKCGTEVRPEDTFCSTCGVKDPSATTSTAGTSWASDLGNRLLWIALGLQVLIVPWNTTTNFRPGVLAGWNSVMRYAPIFDPPTLVASGAPAPSIAMGRLILQLIVTVVVALLLKRALRGSGETSSVD